MSESSTSNFPKFPENIIEPARAPAQGRGMGGHHSASPQTTTWLTPRNILEPLGTFDLDPCSAPDPEFWPTAQTHYTAPKQNGLLLPWFGRVWLNPPYTSPGIRVWMKRMAEHKNGMALIFARVETENFFENVWEAAQAILFLKGRPCFHREDGSTEGNSGAPVALIGYGDRDAEMILDGVLPGAAIPLTRPTMLFALTKTRPDETSETIGTWREVIRDLINNLDQKVFGLHQIYSLMENHPKTRKNPNWRAKIRQTIAVLGYVRQDTAQYALF